MVGLVGRLASCYDPPPQFMGLTKDRELEASDDAFSQARRSAR